MNSFFSAALVILLKWTVLLALGWSAHWVLRKRHSRWRLILWRSILCFALFVPLMRIAPVPVFRIPIYKTLLSPIEPPAVVPPVSSESPLPKDKSAVQSPPKPAEANTAAKSLHPPPQRTASKSIPWESLLVIIWGLGAAFTGLRLVRFQAQLNRLRKESRLAGPVLQGLVREIQAKLEVQQTIGIRISDSASSPFACGLLQPTIMLPQKLVQNLLPDEIAALLAHEIAHFRRHDLVWCVGWRWMQAIFWFHPLVWRIPAAHNLACEQEADRMASGQLQDRAFYSQLLARLALRVLAMPEVETQLVLNGTSQISQRLNHLKQGKVRAWTWRHSAAGFGLGIALFLAATGCELSRTNQAEVPIPVTVQAQFKAAASDNSVAPSIQPEASGHISKILDKEVSIHLDNVPLETILVNLSQATGVNIVADKTLPALKQPLKLDAGGRTNLNVKLGELFRYIARRYDLQFQVGDELVWVVGAKDTNKVMQETRFYRLRKASALKDEAPKEPALERAIKETYRGTYFIDYERNLVVAKGTPEQLDVMERIIQEFGRPLGEGH